MKFTKMHGCGNDYVYVDCFAQSEPDDPAALARSVSERHRGIGSDGLILIQRSGVADARMRMFNADGSEGEMCGNGVRCVGKYIFDRGIARRDVLSIETGSGVVAVRPIEEDGRVERLAVDMGPPRLAAGEIPTTLPGDPVIDAALPYWPAARDLADMLVDAGVRFRINCVSMGNPHAIFFCRDAAAVPLERAGPILEFAPFFPARANIQFCQVKSRDEVTIRTWERGSGVTMACGTGACAVAVAAAVTGRTGRRVLAHLPGGDLELDWSEADNHVYMTGPAVEVFSGEWPD